MTDQQQHQHGKRSACRCGSATTQQVDWQGRGYIECRESGVVLSTESEVSRTQREHASRGIPQHKPVTHPSPPPALADAVRLAETLEANGGEIAECWFCTEISDYPARTFQRDGTCHGFLGPHRENINPPAPSWWVGGSSR